MTYGTWLRHLLLAVRSAGRGIRFTIVRPGKARVTFSDGRRAIMDGWRLRLAGVEDESADVLRFRDAFSAGLLIDHRDQPITVKETDHEPGENCAYQTDIFGNR